MSNSRREFLKKAATATAAIAASDLISFAGEQTLNDNQSADLIPWYKRVTRWGQTNITEKDPLNYDIGWWRKHWKNTNVQGVIINAGGIVAYYPTKIPLHRQAQYLAGRDLFGELCKAAHDDGIVVFARMDSNRAHEEFYKAHPDWFARDAEGKPYKAGELYITCVNSPYYNEHIPSILTEISNLYKPEGFTDNSWSGLGRDTICYCDNCKKSFFDNKHSELPKVKNWDERNYGEWIKWNYNRRLEIWDLNNKTTKAAGGKDCVWSGMNSGSVSGQSKSFRDYKEICERADIIMLDSQARSDAGGFQENSEMGKLIHGLLGWNKLIPESMAQYQMGRPTFRLAVKPEPEARMWMIEGMAGGISPWWHYIGASHEDKRLYRTAAPIFNWHKKNEEYLINREPVATVGIIWSQQNSDFYGREETETIVDLPYRGIRQALLRSRIPFIPVNADHIAREAGKLSLLILPNIGIITDSQASAIKRFVANGGGLLATGESTLYDEWGERRSDFLLGDLFGTHIPENSQKGSGSPLRKRSGDALHTYLRLLPGMEGLKKEKRHPVLNGFEETNIISFGGSLEDVKTDSGSEHILTFIPQFPIYPPETSWMREPVTNIPGLIINSKMGSGRVAFMPADIDRQYGRYNLPDHGNLLTNIIRWAANEKIPVDVKGPGLLDCNLYRQKGRLIIHIVNLTSAGTWRQPVDELITIGPLTLRVMLPDDVAGSSVQLLVAGTKASVSPENGWLSFTVNSVSDHEVAVIS